jgi:hypothetical protein
MKSTTWKFDSTGSSFDGKRIMKEAEAEGLAVVVVTAGDTGLVYVREDVLPRWKKVGLPSPAGNSGYPTLTGGRLDNYVTLKAVCGYVYVYRQSVEEAEAMIRELLEAEAAHHTVSVSGYKL